MNIKQKTLVALLVLGIGISGCSNKDNNSTPPTDNKAVDQNNTDENRTVDQNNTEENVTATILGNIGSQHSNGSSDITIAQLQEITPALSNIDDRYLNIYQRYIASADTNISSPATVDEVQSMIYEVNDFNLPEHAILDRSFFKKTNGIFEHRFVYLPVKNNTTGRTWLNNNLGADYANVDSSAYDPSQQAKTSTDYFAYGSSFQWGRKADGHELRNWTSGTSGTARYGVTSTKADEPSDSLFIKVGIFDKEDWRVNPDDTLWASESSANNVCPAGYRLPLNPNEADDAENELAEEVHSWDSEDVDGAISSDLKLTLTGWYYDTDAYYHQLDHGYYWSGSVTHENDKTYRARDLWFRSGGADVQDYTGRASGMAVRCIKD